jgi:hypothetical protein
MGRRIISYRTCAGNLSYTKTSTNIDICTLQNLENGLPSPYFLLITKILTAAKEKLLSLYMP